MSVEAACTCDYYGGPAPDIDCPQHGMCASYGHPCHCGAPRLMVTVDQVVRACQMAYGWKGVSEADLRSHIRFLAALRAVQRPQEVR